MNFAKFLLMVFFLFAGAHASSATVRIAWDRGGRIGTYLDRYDAIPTSGETVIIDGLCLSACTMVLGAVPHDHICVTSHASMGFHAAYNPGLKGRSVTNLEATQLLYSHTRGGLKSQMIFLHGKEIDEYVPPLLSQCPGVFAALNAARPARMHRCRCTCLSCNATTMVAGTPAHQAVAKRCLCGPLLSLVKEAASFGGGS